MAMTKEIAKDRIGLWTGATMLSFGILLWCLVTLNTDLGQRAEADLLKIYALEGVMMFMTSWLAGKTMFCLTVLLER